MNELDPSVIVIPERRVEGIDSLGEPARKWPAMPLSRALRTRHRTYAHFCLYTLPGEVRWPRINKPVLEELRSSDVPPAIHVTSLDYDSPGHKGSLTPEQFDALLDSIESDAKLPTPTWAYRTRNGARMLYVHPGLDPHDAEAFHRGLAHAATVAGVVMDPTVWEWNRPHALPWGIREGSPIIDDPILYGSDPLTQKQLDALRSLCPDPGFGRVAKVSAAYREGLPDQQEARALVWTPANKLTAWGKNAQKRMAGRDAEAAFEHPAPECPERRNPTLIAWAGSLVSMLHDVYDTTPAHVFGLLLPCIEAWSGPGRDLTPETWRMVAYCWAHEKAQASQAAEATKEAAEELSALIPGAPEDPNEFGSWVRQRLIVSHDHNYYVLAPDGRYKLRPVKLPNLSAALRVSGLVGPGKLLPHLLKQGQQKGSLVPLSAQNLVDMFSTPADEVGFAAGTRLGGTFENGVLTLCTVALRDDIQAERSTRVDGWLKAFFGRAAQIGEEWVAHALRVHVGPIAALSIQGPRGIGKNLLASGLARCFTSKKPLTKDFFSQWQYRAEQTPVIHVDESWPPVSGIDSAFRELIGGQDQPIRRKYEAHSFIALPRRVILTANTDAVVAKLFSRSDMTQDEREAVAERVIHVRVGTGGRDFLAPFAGPGLHEEWIEQDELAKHFLWLGETIPLSGHRQRFLMQGDVEDSFLAKLAFQSEPTAVVGEALLGMLANNKIDLRNRHVRAQQVVEFLDMLGLAGVSRARYNPVFVGRRLREFMEPGTRRLDLGKLRSFARSAGMDWPSNVEQEANP